MYHNVCVKIKTKITEKICHRCWTVSLQTIIALTKEFDHPSTGSLRTVYMDFVITVPAGSAFIKPDQLDPSIKDQLGNALLSIIFTPTVTHFCVMWGSLSFPHVTKFGKCRGEIVDKRMIFIWSLIHGAGWSGLIKAEPGVPTEPGYYQTFGI